MTRKSFTALAVALLAVAVALIAFVDHHSATVEPTAEEGNQEPLALIPHTGMRELTSPVPQASNDENKGAKRHDFERSAGREARPKYSAADEAISRKEIRGEVTRDVHGIYRLPIAGLGLTSSQQDALLSFLIEDEIARTRTVYSSGIGMDEEERSARIAAIIGEAKLEQFLALEQNIHEYREVYYVQSMLKEKGTPLTDTQQVGLAKILVDVRKHIDMKPPAPIESKSIESLEHTLDRLDEYERLALELAPSVLSAKQVKHMFERYQALSHSRADALELQKQRRADNPDDDQLMWYPSRKN
jgi:hypothetical protein